MSDANHPTSSNDGDASGGGSDALLDRATEALRNAPVAGGPSPELMARTLDVLRETRAHDMRMARLRPFHVAVRVAAAVVLAATVFAIYRLATRTPTIAVTPMTHPVSPDQAVVNAHQDSSSGTNAIPKT